MEAATFMPFVCQNGGNWQHYAIKREGAHDNKQNIFCKFCIRIRKKHYEKGKQKYSNSEIQKCAVSKLLDTRNVLPIYYWFNSKFINKLNLFDFVSGFNYSVYLPYYSTFIYIYAAWSYFFSIIQCFCVSWKIGHLWFNLIFSLLWFKVLAITK